jgi:multiple sugar transport system ATP-binding protein
MNLFLDGISKRFGSASALEDVSIDIRDGEFLVLLGPSGCGKSTLLRIIAGLLPPTSGRVLADDRDVTALPPRERDVAMVFQSYALYPHLTVRRNLGFGLRVKHRPKAEIDRAVAGVAEQLGLSELLDRRPKDLSGGQRQRVALGRAMVRDPSIFLMDEPLSNLDAQLRTATRIELAELHRSLGTTFVYVTHDQVEAMTMATRIAVLNKGHLEQIGTPTEIYDRPQTRFVAGFLGAPPMNLIDGELQGRDGRITFTAPGVEVRLWNGAVEAQAATLGVRPEHLSVVDPGSDRSCVRFTVRVLAIENLGNEEIAICGLGDGRLAFRGARPLGVVAGDEVTLSADAEHLALFDAGSGRRLEWVGEQAPAKPARTDRAIADAALTPAGNA